MCAICECFQAPAECVYVHFNALCCICGCAPRAIQLKTLKMWSETVEAKLLIHHNSGFAREIITYREDYPFETIPSEPASVEWRPADAVFVLKIEINYIYLRRCRPENFFHSARFIHYRSRPMRRRNKSSFPEKFAGRVKETGIWHWHAKGSSGDVEFLLIDITSVRRQLKIFSRALFELPIIVGPVDVHMNNIIMIIPVNRHHVDNR